jgi:hypothetical protein
MSVHSFPNQILWRSTTSGFPGLQCSSPQCLPCQHISLPERGGGIRQPMLLAKVTNKWRNLPKVAPREARKQMVLDLELQATVEPIHPWRALNVERARRLLLEPVIPLWRPDIHLRGEVVQAELNMLNPGNHEARDHERHPLPPIGQAGHHHWVPNPERGDARDLQPPLWHLPARQQEDGRLNKEVYPGEAHDRVECPVLVADQELGRGVEHQGALVEVGPEAEQLGGDGEERHVLEVRVVVEAVAGNVVGVVVALPPRDAEAGEAVAGEHLEEAVERGVPRDPVVPRVVPHPPGLDPDEPDEPAGEEVRPRARAGEDAVERGAEEEQHPGDLHLRGGPHPLEQPRGGELREEAAEVGGRRRDRVVLEPAHEEPPQERARRRRVVGGERVGGVLPRQRQERDVAARVVGHPRRDVVHVPGDGDPQVVPRRVRAELLRGDHADAGAGAALRLLGGGRHCGRRDRRRHGRRRRRRRDSEMGEREEEEEE